MQISNRDISWYNLALKVAADSDASDKHGCVIVRSGTVLALATNRYIRTCTSEKQGHAEQRALVRVGMISAEGSTLYSARSHWRPTSAPCPSCTKLLQRFRIKYVVFHDGTKLQKQRVI